MVSTNKQNVYNNAINRIKLINIFYQFTNRILTLKQYSYCTYWILQLKLLYFSLALLSVKVKQNFCSIFNKSYFKNQ